jgi:ATP-binding cassette, subfamily A (ABC1), member 3
MLEIHKDKRVNMLSGGMKRKLSLGMSLVGKSSVIILDEPTSGLDVDSRREVWELIKQVKRNRCVILST